MGEVLEVLEVCRQQGFAVYSSCSNFLWISMDFVSPIRVISQLKNSMLQPPHDVSNIVKNHADFEFNRWAGFLLCLLFQRPFAEWQGSLYSCVCVSFLKIWIEDDRELRQLEWALFSRPLSCLPEKVGGVDMTQ